MKKRILFVATYEQQIDIVKQLAQKNDIAVDVFLGGIMRGGHIHAYENQDKYDVFVVYGAGAVYLRKMTSKPVISPRHSFKSILNTYFRAVNFGDPVLIFAYNDIHMEDFMLISSFLPQGKCDFFLYNSIKEFNYNLNKISSYNNVTILAMGDCILKNIKEKDKVNYIVFEDTNAIEYALNEANSIAVSKNNEKINNEKINKLIQNSIEGIIILDNSSTIISTNECAGSLTGVLSNSLIGKNILDASLPKLFHDFYGDGASSAGMRIHFKDSVFLANRINILQDNENKETILTFHKLPRQHSRVSKSDWGNSGLVARYDFKDIVGHSQGIQTTIERAKKYSATEAPILIEGETGTGKELFVQSIHNASPRKHGPFVAVNCAALPETLLESELFGYEEGAFTGARRGGKKGILEIGNTGTIFLDEISASSLNIQSRLLRALQEKEMMRVGGTRVLRIDIRIIAATNKNLYSLVQEGKFRNDLYFRLRHLKLSLPPLRNRKEDIMPLLLHFVPKNPCSRKILHNARKLAELLQWYAWPGNVRELKHFIESLVVLCEPSTDILELAGKLLDECKHEVRDMAGETEGDGDNILLPVGDIKDMRKDILRQVLAHCNGDKKLAAQRLKVSRVTLWKMLKDDNEI
ncbi:MAG: sigma 54-interacting transcriptional regulator [Desulfovibrio sp.]|nr:sigma 54-interacting transcriptional regulator [Desulfovibrio sp.]